MPQKDIAITASYGAASLASGLALSSNGVPWTIAAGGLAVMSLLAGYWAGNSLALWLALLPAILGFSLGHADATGANEPLPVWLVQIELTPAYLAAIVIGLAVRHLVSRRPGGIDAADESPSPLLVGATGFGPGISGRSSPNHASRQADPAGAKAAAALSAAAPSAGDTALRACREGRSP